MVGKEKWAKEKELRLSDAYIVKDNEPSLELKVKVINIRPEEPYKKAIKECIEKGILADYLMRKISKWRTGWT